MRTLRRLLFCLICAAGAVSAPAAAETIAIIGTGDVAGALGPEFARQGHEIVYGSRDPDRPSVDALVERTGADASATGQADSVVGADIVVMAVPGDVAADETGDLGDLAGKIIIDPTNRIGQGDDGALSYPVRAGTSNAELIQAAAPEARVVKAFNTLSYETMVEPERAGGPVTIPIVGDDADARATVAELVEGMGLEPFDLGPLRYARVLEEMLMVWANARGRGMPFNYYLRPEPAR